MKQKLLDIKLILRIIISVLIIFSMLKSCAKALSYEEIQHYVQETAILYHNNPHYQYIKTCIDNARTYFEPKNNTLANYRNVYIEREGVSDRYIDVYVYYTCDRVNSSGMYMTGKNIRYRYDGSSWWLQSQSNDFFVAPSRCYSSSTEQYNSLLGMNYTYNEVESIYTTPATYVGNQGLHRINELEYTNYITPNVNTGTKLIYYYKGDIYTQITIPLGEIDREDAYHYEIWLENDETQEDLAYIWVDYSTGQVVKSSGNGILQVNGSNMLLLKTLYINYNTRYRVTITSYYGDMENPTTKSMQILYMFLPKNTTISGDTINFISGDSINGDTIQIIGNQDQIKEENQNFFENLYNNLFTISSGEVSGEVNKLIASLNLETSGEQQIVSMIYDEFNKEPTDFIISWQPAALTIEGKTIQIIPSGEINFSEKCREEPSLTRVKGIVNVITSAYLLIVLLIANQDMILRLLGTENRFLDADKDELIVDVQGIAYEQLPYTTNLPTYSGTDPNYWWHRARKRF